MPADDDLVLVDVGQESLRTCLGPSVRGNKPLWSKGVTWWAPIEAAEPSSAMIAPMLHDGFPTTPPSVSQTSGVDRTPLVPRGVLLRRGFGYSGRWAGRPGSLQVRIRCGSSGTR